MRQIDRCRLCGNSDLISIINLGNQFLTGVFPKKKEQQITSGPLALVRCNDVHNSEACGLLQLEHSYDLDELYGTNYGYRSGLNSSMVDHLESIVNLVSGTINLGQGDYVLDIGSNDGTLLSFYPENLDLNLIGMDPTGTKYLEFYQKRIQLIPKFFSSVELLKIIGSKKVKAVTSISMFYDLESPLDFIREVNEILDDDGVWVIEQSYMPTMLEVTAYDTICHEHLEYYGLKQILWMTAQAGLKIISLSLNDTNGGSFCVMMAKVGSSYPECTHSIAELQQKELKMRLNTDLPYVEFNQRVIQHKKDIIQFLDLCRQEDKKVLGYGASTKGNVIIQYCVINQEQIPFIAEVNPDKYGSFTPGSLIPIISEKDALDMDPDYFFVFPWHFRKNIIGKEKSFLDSGGKLFFPLPTLDFYPPFSVKNR
jgi:NDP-4-keto-2,6-dideoxyhexose 3-C-methyltransferase